MGCVSFTQRYFRDGKITPARYAQAYTAARLELMSIENALHRLTWDEAIGSSGTIRAIGAAIKAGGLGNGEVNAEGLAWVKRKLFKLGETDKIDFEGVKPDRRTIFPAGLAILEAIFDALELQRMDHCDGALREGVLFDLLGRHHHEDVRERTLNSLMERYHVDQAKRRGSSARRCTRSIRSPRTGNWKRATGATCSAGRRKCTKWGWILPTITTTSTAPT